MKMDSLIAGDYIKLTSYHPDAMTYEVKSQNEQLAMFSEMYYPPEKGWNVYIDGKKQDPSFIKANYVLRAARIPAGEYTLEMKFEPQSFYTGRKIALVCSLLIIAGFFFMMYKNYVNYTPTEPVIEEEAPSSEQKRTEKTDNRPRRKSPKKRKK